MWNIKYIEKYKVKSFMLYWLYLIDLFVLILIVYTVINKNPYKQAQNLLERWRKTNKFCMLNVIN